MAQIGFIAPPAPFTPGDPNETPRYAAVRALASCSNIKAKCWLSQPKLSGIDPGSYPSSSYGTPSTPSQWSTSRFHGWADQLVSRGDIIIMQVSFSSPNDSTWRAIDGTTDWTRYNSNDGYASRPPSGSASIVWQRIADIQAYSILEMADYIRNTYGVDPSNYIEVMLPNEPRKTSPDLTVSTTTTGTNSAGASTLNITSTGGIVANQTYLTVQHTGGVWTTYKVGTINSATQVAVSPSLTEAIPAGTGVKSADLQTVASPSDYYQIDSAFLNQCDLTVTRLQAILGTNFKIWGFPMHGPPALLEGYASWVTNATSGLTFPSKLFGWSIDYYEGASFGEFPIYGDALGFPGAKEYARRYMLAMDRWVAFTKTKSLFTGKQMMVKEFGPVLPWGAKPVYYPFRTSDYGKYTLAVIQAYQKRSDLYRAIWYKPETTNTGTPVWNTQSYAPINNVGNADAAIRELVRGSDIDNGTLVPTGFANAGSSYSLAVADVLSS